MTRLEKLNLFLAAAELDIANNELYIEDLKLSIAFEKRQLNTVYGATTNDEHHE